MNDTAIDGNTFTMPAKNVTVTYSLQPIAVPGDVNSDGTLSIADVTMLVNMVLGKADKNSAADVNGDGQVTIADVTQLVNLVLGKAPATQE